MLRAHIVAGVLAGLCLPGVAAAQSAREYRLPDGSRVTPAPIVPGVTVDGRIVTGPAAGTAAGSGAGGPVESRLVIPELDVRTTGSIQPPPPPDPGMTTRDCTTEAYNVGNSVVRVRRC